ncbi:hypothetical protein EVAR_59476_1 [Eumeta japonica]|uniref:Uncharacterized protein n=1 Tax=Eumeta variegata TaxID=151549 RepID=A0A4C1YWZ9_EUMVA|nr:hypothetical protein EVAR_59476_1 [Eumeta japonica]
MHRRVPLPFDVSITRSALKYSTLRGASIVLVKFKVRMGNPTLTTFVLLLFGSSSDLGLSSVTKLVLLYPTRTVTRDALHDVKWRLIATPT